MSERYSHQSEDGQDQSKVDPYGFARPEDFDFKSYEKFMTSYLSVLARRSSRWTQNYVKSELKVTRTRKLKRFCRKGIPGDLRPEIWFQVSDAAKRQSEQPNRYRMLSSQQTDPAVTDTILLDIHRTFPENVYFQDGDPSSLRKPLQNVLEALSLSSPHIGYCQGMNFVVGLLLLIVKNEERTFWLMDTLIKTILPDYYAADMIAVQSEQELLGDIVKWKLPVLHAHLDSLGVQWGLVGMKWFIALFADVMPVETVLRIWDCLFYEGSKILLRVGLALITINRERLLKCTNFPQAVDTFSAMVKEVSTQDCHKFIESIFLVTGSMPSSKISKMRDKCVREAIKSR